MAIVMTAAMPVWKHDGSARERRGAGVSRRADTRTRSACFSASIANAYPPSLDVLVEQKFLRKKYKDPITDDDFAPLTQASQQGGVQPGGAQRGGQPATPAAGRGAQTTGRGPTGSATPAGAAPLGGGPAGGIVGVTSKSTDTSIRLYKGRSHYNEWAFVYTAPVQAPGAAAAWPAWRSTRSTASALAAASRDAVVAARSQAVRTGPGAAISRPVSRPALLEERGPGRGADAVP